MLRLWCVLSSGCEHDRILESGDNRDSPLHDETMSHYHCCLCPPALHCLCYGTIREHARDQATAGASNGSWQVVFGDKVTEHHFCNSQPIPERQSSAHVQKCILGCDALTTRMLSSAVCACAMHTGM